MINKTKLIVERMCSFLNKYIYVYTKDTIAESIRQKFVLNEKRKKNAINILKTSIYMFQEVKKIIIQAIVQHDGAQAGQDVQQQNGQDVVRRLVAMGVRGAK